MKFLSRYGFLLLIIFLGVFLRFYLLSEKKYFHHDAIFTLETINGDSFADARTNEIYSHKWIKGSDLLADTEVSREERWRFNDVNNLLEKYDLHPPLHYYFIHIANVVLNKGSPSYWPGVVFNIIVYLVTSVLLYKCTLLLTNNNVASLFAALLFAVFPMCLSMSMLVRMYELAVCCSLAILYGNLLFVKKVSLFSLVFLVVSLVLGCLSHYYVIAYALVVFVMSLLSLLYKNDLKLILVYIGVNSIAAVVYFLIWPEFFNQILNNPYLSSVINFSSGFVLLLAFVIFVILAYIYVKLLKGRGFPFKVEYELIVVVSALATFLFILKIRPYDHLVRYFYILIPSVVIIFSCSMCRFLSWVSVLKSEGSGQVRFGRVDCFHLGFVMILVVFSVKKPELYTVDHLFKNHFSKGSLLEVFKNSDKNTPVIVVRDYNNRNRKFHSYHKEWNVGNVMPLLYDKNNIYMVDETKFDEDLITSTKTKFDSDDVFVLS